MKTVQQAIIAAKKRAKAVRLNWKLIALFFPVTLIVLMLMSAQLIKEKQTIHYQVSSSYRAGDVALFVVMPLLNTALK